MVDHAAVHVHNTSYWVGRICMSFVEHEGSVRRGLRGCSRQIAMVANTELHVINTVSSLVARSCVHVLY